MITSPIAQQIRTSSSDAIGFPSAFGSAGFFFDVRFVSIPHIIIQARTDGQR